MISFASSAINPGFLKKRGRSAVPQGACDSCDTQAGNYITDGLEMTVFNPVNSISYDSSPAPLRHLPNHAVTWRAEGPGRRRGYRSAGKHRLHGMAVWMFDHAALGHDEIDQSGWHHVKYRIPRPRAFDDGAHAAHAQQFPRVAQLDLDVGTAPGMHVDRGGRRHDHELHVVVARHHRQLVSADLVGGVAVGGNAVGANDDPLHGPGVHQEGRG